MKNVQAAEKAGITTQELCDANAEKFKDLMNKIGYSYDALVKSSSKKQHVPGVHKLWQLCDKAGDIYKKKYKGLYCVGCEVFYAENELTKEGLCQEHLKKPEEVEEENYFFRLSKYQSKLELLIKKDELKIYPETRKNEVLSFIQRGLQDFSVSRSVSRAKGWGIPVPGDTSQIIYVWFDALACYITGVGYGTDENLFAKWWPPQVEVIGKGIIKFHAIYWIGMLLSANLPLPKSLFVHGYITIEGQKMSKSLGNVIDPFYLIDTYGVDELRYCLLSEVSTFEDGDFSERVLVEKNNSELLANVGNLVNRTLVFIKNNFDGKVPEGVITAADQLFIDTQNECIEKITKHLENYDLSTAIHQVMFFSKNANRYFQETAPWKLVKEDKKRAESVLYVLVNQVKDLAILLWPFIPNTSEAIFKQLNCKAEKWDGVGKVLLKKDHKLGEPSVLFKKLELKKKENHQSEQQSISFFDLDIEVGEILSAEQHPNAEKLLVEKVKVKDGEINLVSGIAKYYLPEEIVGKKIMVLRNIPSAKLRGVESQGMLLVCESKEGDVEIIHPDADVGTKITIGKETQTPKKQLTIDDFFKVKMEIKAYIGYAEGKKLLVAAKELRTKKLKEGKIT